MRGLMTLAVAAILTCLAAAAQAPTAGFWQLPPSPTTASLRGLSVVSDRVIWASGTGGTILRTLDGGAHWQAIAVPGASRLDFRDIKAFGADIAYAAAIAAGGGIYKTSDGGRHWRLQYALQAANFFLDGLAFWNANHGLALGDPMQGKFLVLKTDDGGVHWRRILDLPPALPGEGAFAASGTALVAGPGGRAWFATGGPGGARVFRTSDAGASWQVVTTPIEVGTAGAGIFSLAFHGSLGVAVGGDYTRPQASTRTAALSENAGAVWTLAPGSMPSGYRSAVAWLPGGGGQDWIAVGTNGGDISLDGGRDWRRVSDQGFNSVAATPGGTLWAVGARGRLGRHRGGLRPHPQPAGLP